MKRYARTVAKVRGSVGKVTEVDEKTRFKLDFLRMRIACVDITKVQRTFKGTLGMLLHDFTFEREVVEEGKEKSLKGGIKVGEGDQPPSKSNFKPHAEALEVFEGGPSQIGKKILSKAGKRRCCALLHLQK